MKEPRYFVKTNCYMNTLVVAPATSSMRRWRLVRNFVVRIRIGVRKTGEVKVQSLTIPKGFETDFASVPRIFHSIFPPTGRYGVAALVHDYLCVEKPVTRREADAIFYDLMKRHGVKLWKAKVLYAAVRLYAIVTGVDRRERSLQSTGAPEPQ